MTAPAPEKKPRRELDLVAAVKGETVSPEAAALLIARDAKPELDVDVELARIDDIAATLDAPDPSAPARDQAGELAGHLYERWGFHGNEEAYYDPRNSYLDDVLRRRTGIPITLAVVLGAVGRRVGVRVEMIGFPGHFLARVGGDDGVLVDPFFGGRILEHADLERLAARMLGNATRLRSAHLAPIGLRALTVRMLMNLKHAHERARDHARALVVCDRLVDLTDAPNFRRDRGMHALELGARAQAADDLEAYLEAEGDEARDAAEVKKALARARAYSQPPS